MFIFQYTDEGALWWLFILGSNAKVLDIQYNGDEIQYSFFFQLSRNCLEEQRRSFMFCNAYLYLIFCLMHSATFCTVCYAQVCAQMLHERGL